MKLFFHWHTTSGKTSTILFSSNTRLQKEILQVGKSDTSLLCSGWAAAAETLFPSSRILGKSLGKLVYVAPWAATDMHKGAGWEKSQMKKKSFTWTFFFSVNKLVRAHWRLLRQVVLQELTRMWDIWKLQPCWMLIQPPLLTDHCAVLLYRWCLHDVEWPLGTTLTFQSLA